MSRPLLLVGAGGFARETAELVRALAATSAAWDLLGYLDDDPALAGRTVSGARVLGPIDMVHDRPDAAVVVCTGNPRNYSSRARIVERLGLARERYATLVHPAAVVPSSCRLGAGTVVHAGTVLTVDVHVGDHVAVMPAVVLTHDDVVEDFATFGAGVRLAGGVHVERGAYVGSGASVRENLRVGAWSTIGMGSVVTHDVTAATVWAGVPARELHPVAAIVAEMLAGATPRAAGKDAP